MNIVNTSQRLPALSTEPVPYQVIVKPANSLHYGLAKGVLWNGAWINEDGTPFSAGQVVSWVDPNAVVFIPTVAPVKATEEATSFNVILKGAQATAKIAVIKLIRELTGLGLKEAKDFVEGAPKTVKEGLTSQEAVALQERLVAVGGLAEKVAA